MEVTHLQKRDFGYVHLNGLCQSSDGILFGSGYIDPLPDRGNLLRISPGGTHSRIGQGLKQSYAVAFERSSSSLIVSANDGTTPNRSGAPNGLFRIAMDGSFSIVTHDVTGGALPVATDAAGNLYYPGIFPNTQGQSILRRSSAGGVDCIASEFRQIVGIAADEHGNLAVADAESYIHEGVLFRVDQNGKVGVLVSEDDLRPHALALGKDGSIFFSSIRGANGDISEIYRVDPNGQITLVADGLVAGTALAYDAKHEALYAIDFFLNFLVGHSDIPDEYHNDTLILRITDDGDRVPKPFYQAAPPVKLSPMQRIHHSAPGYSEVEPDVASSGGPDDLAAEVIAEQKMISKVFPTFSLG